MTTNRDTLKLIEARLTGRSSVKLTSAKNGLDAYRVVRPDGEVREFCFDAENQGTMRTMASAFAGAGAAHEDK